MLWTVYGLLGALTLSYFGLLIVRPASESSTLIDTWLVFAGQVVASALCFARALLRRAGRIVPMALGASLLAWTLGDLVFAIESMAGTTPPTPSLADAFYLAFFPFAYLGIATFMRGETRRLNTPSWLDSVVAALGAAAVCAAFAFSSIQRSAGGGTLEVATNLAYPVGDLLLLALVVGGTVMLSGRRKAPWFLLASGMGLNAIGDTFALFGSSAGASHFGVVLNGIAWPAAILLISMAVWVRPGHSDPLAFEKPPGFLLPGLASVAALAVLVVGTLDRLSAVAVALATATLAAVGVRLARSVGALRTLTRERRNQSVTDHLTGLGNRRYLFDVMDAFFAEQADGQIEHRSLAFLYVDLNRFKEVNDSFGHPAGDELLMQLGERLRAPLSDRDALVRLGGDEFAVVLMDADADRATAIARRLAATFEDPFIIDNVSVGIGASIGISRAPIDATDGAALVSCADAAMYRAKRQAEPFALYEPELDDSGNSLRLAEELRAAVDADELVLYYQPQLELDSGKVESVEALVRWPHPRLGMIPPLTFLPLAEQAGLMDALTSSVLDMALDQCASWRAAGTTIQMSVNISATNLLADGFCASVKRSLAHHGLPPSALVLEITETSIIAEFERAGSVVDHLRELGVVVSIDDFGTGFTSLAYLSGLSVGELKLDRTFITRLTESGHRRDVQLVRATIDLAHALELRVVAEGIEDAETLSLLLDLGCDIGQGYFIGTPQPAAAHKLTSTPVDATGVGDKRRRSGGHARAATPLPATSRT